MELMNEGKETVRKLEKEIQQQDQKEHQQQHLQHTENMNNDEEEEQQSKEKNLSQEKLIEADNQQKLTFNLTISQQQLLMELIPINYSLVQTSEINKNQKLNVFYFRNKGFKQLQIQQEKNSSAYLFQQQQQREVYKKEGLKSKTKQQITEPKFDDQYLANQKSKFQNKDNQQMLKICYKILILLKQNVYSGPFLEPVDADVLNIPEYYQIIKHPMDLSTVENKLRQGEYETPDAFYNDLKLIWNNAYSFNIKNSDIYKYTKIMDAFCVKAFKEQFREMLGEESINIIIKDSKWKQKTSKSDQSKELRRTVDKMSSQIKTMHSKQNKKQKKDQQLEKPFVPADTQPLSLQEKQELGKKIYKLPEDYLNGIYNIVKESLTGTQTDEIVIDLDILNNETIKKLQNYVDNALKTMKAKSRSKKKTKDQQSQVFQSDSSHKNIGQPIQQQQGMLQQQYTQMPNNINPKMQQEILKQQQQIQQQFMAQQYLQQMQMSQLQQQRMLQPNLVGQPILNPQLINSQIQQQHLLATQQLPIHLNTNIPKQQLNIPQGVQQQSQQQQQKKNENNDQSNSFSSFLSESDGE